MFKTIKYGSGYGQREFDLEPYKSWQEREILLASSLNEDEFLISGIDKIFEYLKTNIIFKNDYKLTKNEKIYILYMLRSISVSESINSKNICPECKKPFDLELPIENFVKMPENFQNSFELNDYTLYYKDSFEDNEIENYFFKIKNNINSIETSNEKDIENFINELNVEEEIILKSFVEQNKTKFEFASIKKCPYCKSEFKIPMDSDSFVISILSEDSLISLYKTISNMIFHSNYSKTDIDNMIPFERGIFVSLLDANLKELREVKK